MNNYRDNNTGRSGLFRFGPFRPGKVRTLRVGSSRPVQFMWVAITGSFRTSLGLFFLVIMIKLQIFKNWKTLRSSQN